MEEFFRIVVIGALGSIMTFFIQPFLLQGSPDASLGSFKIWLEGGYRFGAGSVFFVSLAMAFAWYFVARKARTEFKKSEMILSIFWWMFLLVQFISIWIACHFFRVETNWQISNLLPFLYLPNVLIVYWLATALGTPGLFKFVVPGSILIRPLFDQNR